AMRLSVRRLDLVAFLREIVLAFRSRAEREGIALSFSSESDAIPGAFDPDKLEKVVANLLSNAFKFTPSGGKIRVRIEADADDVASITVKDTGRGIPKEELPHVFERFYQVDDSAVRNQEGTGIGLALAKELLELHEGSIDVESEVGFGTAFTIRLPIVAESETIPEETSPETASDESLELYHMADEVSRSAVQECADTEESSAADAAPSDAPVILIVEDNPDMRAYIKSHLEAQYRTIEARNGLEGLELARAHAPGLVLADVMMPKMDGYALCRALKSDPELDHIPVVILTAKSDMESKLEGLETGADDYLEKPFSAEELLVRMENLIELRRRLRDRFGGRMRLGPSDVSVDSEDAAFVREVRDVIEAKISESRFGVGELA
ncbi:MAG: hybrid sensor histidine kinase/response regulator, partial [Rhodothermales bacterium]